MKHQFLTYNIHRTIELNLRLKLDRIKRTILDHNADVVLLQEVDDGVPRSRGMDMAKEITENHGDAYYAAGHNVKLGTGRYGHATLSRHPNLKERNIDLIFGTSLRNR